MDLKIDKQFLFELWYEFSFEKESVAKLNSKLNKSVGRKAFPMYTMLDEHLYWELLRKL